MSTIDIVLIVVLVVFILNGLRSGFINTFGSLVGSLIGVAVSGMLINYLSKSFGFFSNPVILLVTFLLITLFFVKLIGWIFGLIDEAYKIISFLPFLKTANKLAGGILGFVEGLIMLFVFGALTQTVFKGLVVFSTVDSSWIYSRLIFPVSSYFLNLF